MSDTPPFCINNFADLEKRTNTIVYKDCKVCLLFFVTSLCVFDFKLIKKVLICAEKLTNSIWLNFMFVSKKGSLKKVRGRKPLHTVIEAKKTSCTSCKDEVIGPELRIMIDRESSLSLV